MQVVERVTSDDPKRRIHADNQRRHVCATLALEEYRIDEVYALDVQWP
jgi:hypothetical protein